MRNATNEWPYFHDWVRRRYGGEFMERALFGAHCKLSTKLVYYPVLDEASPIGSYVLKAMAFAEKEEIRASYRD